jgi:hypothetical protein
MCGILSAMDEGRELIFWFICIAVEEDEDAIVREEIMRLKDGGGRRLINESAFVVIFVWLGK